MVQTATINVVKTKNQKRRRNILRTGFTLATFIFFAGMISLYANEEEMFPKGHKVTSVVAIDMNKLDFAEQVMVSTLQGILAKSSSKQILMDEAGSPLKKFVVDQNEITVTNTPDVWALLTGFATNVDGYILYDKTSNKASVNVATSLCGICKAIAVDASLESHVRNAGVTRMIMDVRSHNEEWVYENYRKHLNPSLGVELSEKIGYHLRDYAVMVNAFVFYDDGLMRQRILKDWPTGGILVGYTDVSKKGEYGSFLGYSQRGIYFLGADMAADLSLLSSFSDKNLHQKTHSPKLITETETNVHYVTFLMSDGDNVAFDLWSLYFQFSNPSRGKFSMGWPVLASMADYAPSALRWYYQNAFTADGAKDNFIAAGGITGSYLNAWPSNQLVAFSRKLNAYMKRADMRALLTIGYNGFNRLDVWDKLTAQPNIDGIFYDNYGGPNTGRVLFSKGKPVIEISDVLWRGIEDETTLAKRINSAPRNPHQIESYSTVLVHAWTMNLGDVQHVIDMLEPNVRVVTPEELIALIRKNVTAQNLGQNP